MRLLYGNFDFEHQLASIPPTSASRRIDRELAFSLAAIAEPGDLIWVIERPEAEFADHLKQIGLPDIRFVDDFNQVPPAVEFCPWGWSASVTSWAASHGLNCRHPDLAVVKEVNSRTLSAGLEREWSVGLPGARSVHSLNEFTNAIAAMEDSSRGWVAKADLGMSGRERVLGRENNLPEKSTRWIDRQLQSSGVVHIEPWVERIEEFGIQLEIPADGQPMIVGITSLLCDAQGTYRGSRLPPVDDPTLASRPELEQIREIANRTALTIQSRGYFGPLGIDVMKYRTPSGETRWRPLQDINARWTMGRVALGLRPLVQAGQFASWLHLPLHAEHRERPCEQAPADVDVVRTSPLTIGGAPATLTSLLLRSSSLESLQAAERVILSDKRQTNSAK